MKKIVLTIDQIHVDFAMNLASPNSISFLEQIYMTKGQMSHVH